MLGRGSNQGHLSCANGFEYPYVVWTWGFVSIFQARIIVRNGEKRATKFTIIIRTAALVEGMFWNSFHHINEPILLWKAFRQVSARITTISTFLIFLPVLGTDRKGYNRGERLGYLYGILVVFSLLNSTTGQKHS